MTLVKKIVGFAGVGLLSLAMLAGPAEALTNFAETGGLTLGLRGGGILPSTDLDGKFGVHGATFMRYGVREKLRAELGVGYGRFITEDFNWIGNPPNQTQDLTSVDEYMTHLSFVELRLLFAPVIYEKWNPFIFGGLGYLYFNVEDITPRRGEFDGIGSTLGIPLGLGARYELSDRVGLEGSFGYTLSFDAQIDEDDGGSNDNYMELTLGLTYDLTMGQVAERPTPKPKPKPPVVVPEAPEAPKDQDGDGLTDQEEKTVYYTNPLMADSDGDGLTDGDEVKVYRTNPNKADSDSGSVDDGEEIQRGTDPLDAADDVVEMEERAMPPVEFELPVVYFLSGGAKLSDDAMQKLSAAAGDLMKYRGVLVEVGGHADNQGYPAENMRLAWKRAYAVKDYLMQQGVIGWRMTVKAYGAKQPIVSNDTAEGRGKNRRVELAPIQ